MEHLIKIHSFIFSTFIIINVNWCSFLHHWIKFNIFHDEKSFERAFGMRVSEASLSIFFQAACYFYIYYNNKIYIIWIPECYQVRNTFFNKATYVGYFLCTGCSIKFYAAHKGRRQETIWDFRFGSPLIKFTTKVNCEFWFSRSTKKGEVSFERVI